MPLRTRSQGDVKKPLRTLSQGDVKKPLRTRSQGDVKKPLRTLSQGDVKKPLRTLSQGDVKMPLRTRSQGDVKKPLRTLSQGDVKKPLRTRSQGDVKKPLRTLSQGDVKKPLRTRSQGDVKEPLRTLAQGDVKTSLRTPSQGDAFLIRRMPQLQTPPQGDVTPPQRQLPPPVLMPMKRQKEIESLIFRERNGKELGKTMRKLISWEHAGEFTVAPSTKGKNDWLMQRFHTFRNSLPPDTPLDHAVTKFAWSVLGSASPASARDYMGRIAKQLTLQGETGVRTKHYRAVRATLKRTGTYIRPSQAPPITTKEVWDSIKTLQERDQTRAASMLAIAWVSRNRIPDIRFVTTTDFVEVGNRGGSPSRVSAAVYAKEKGRQDWCEAVYLPAGKMTAVAVEFFRSEPARTCVFGGDGARYERIKRQIRSALPNGAWLHSTKRGAAQEINLLQEDKEEMKDALRHKSLAMTSRYLDSLNAPKRRKQEELLRPLQ